LVAVVLAIVAIVFATASTDYWTVMRFFGSRGITLSPDAWRDPVFAHTLAFYLFDLQFYSQVLVFVLALSILCALLFWFTARGWQLIALFQVEPVTYSPTTDIGPLVFLLQSATSY